jgi:hypothetical protein
MQHTQTSVGRDVTSGYSEPVVVRRRHEILSHLLASFVEDSQRMHRRWSGRIRAVILFLRD